MLPFCRARWAVSLVALGCLTAGVTARVRGLGTQTAGPASTLVEMRHHFLQITRMHEALLRGELGAIVAPAKELERVPTPAGLAEKGAPYLAMIRRLAAQGATAPNLRTAATATVNMLLQCSGCHQAVGVYPAPSVILRPDVGGPVGHMLEHQRAVDEMLQGLIIPSGSSWRSGAQRLKVATLRRRDYPPDPKMTREVWKAEEAVHALAGRATSVVSSTARAGVYADLITTCASCHSLHSKIWGPKSVQ
jgi:hypothetical protein